MENLVGREIEGRYGAMHPIEFGVIYAREGNNVVIRWEEDNRKEIVERNRLIEEEGAGELGKIGLYLMPYNAPGY